MRTRWPEAGNECFFLGSMLEEILNYRNISKALKQVMSNKGAGGVDGMQTDGLRDYLNDHWRSLKASILEGSYQPSPVRKVEIPKPTGGRRMLGIPTVIDRLLQQAISQWLSPQYEPEFSKSSYGFRPGRNARQAVTRAQEYINEGKTRIVELDLEKFFDRVNHDKLMGLLAKKIKDKRILALIGSYLRSGIMEGGVSSPRSEGTPQGSPLSPLLSNIMLDELDKELARRGHSFVRYADDCSIYLKNWKSAQRVERSIIRYIEKELKLKVNRAKTKVSTPTKSTLLGFSFYRSKEKWEIRLSSLTVKRIQDKIRLNTQRHQPVPLAEKIRKLETAIAGWINYFWIAKAKSQMQMLDELVRTRLRICTWKQWKLPKARVKRLIKLGVKKGKAYEWGNSSKGYCRVAHSPILLTTLNKLYFTKLGYTGFENRYFWKTKHQLSIF